LGLVGVGVVFVGGFRGGGFVGMGKGVFFVFFRVLGGEYRGERGVGFFSMVGCGGFFWVGGGGVFVPGVGGVGEGVCICVGTVVGGVMLGGWGGVVLGGGEGGVFLFLGLGGSGSVWGVGEGGVVAGFCYWLGGGGVGVFLVGGVGQWVIRRGLWGGVGGMVVLWSREEVGGPARPGDWARAGLTPAYDWFFVWAWAGHQGAHPAPEPGGEGHGVGKSWRI